MKPNRTRKSEEKRRSMENLKNQVNLCVVKIKQWHWNQGINAQILKNIDLAKEAMAVIQSESKQTKKLRTKTILLSLDWSGGCRWILCVLNELEPSSPQPLHLIPHILSVCPVLISWWHCSILKLQKRKFSSIELIILQVRI